MLCELNTNMSLIRSLYLLEQSFSEKELSDFKLKSLCQC